MPKGIPKVQLPGRTRVAANRNLFWLQEKKNLWVRSKDLTHGHLYDVVPNTDTFECLICKVSGRKSTVDVIYNGGSPSFLELTDHTEDCQFENALPEDEDSVLKIRDEIVDRCRIQFADVVRQEAPEEAVQAEKDGTEQTQNEAVDKKKTVRQYSKRKDYPKSERTLRARTKQEPAIKSNVPVNSKKPEKTASLQKTAEPGVQKSIASKSTSIPITRVPRVFRKPPPSVVYYTVNRVKDGAEVNANPPPMFVPRTCAESPPKSNKRKADDVDESDHGQKSQKLDNSVLHRPSNPTETCSDSPMAQQPVSVPIIINFAKKKLDFGKNPAQNLQVSSCLKETGQILSVSAPVEPSTTATSSDLNSNCRKILPRPVAPKPFPQQQQVIHIPIKVTHRSKTYNPTETIADSDDDDVIALSPPLPQVSTSTARNLDLAAAHDPALPSPLEVVMSRQPKGIRSIDSKRKFGFMKILMDEYVWIDTEPISEYVSIYQRYKNSQSSFCKNCRENDRGSKVQLAGTGSFIKPAFEIAEHEEECYQKLDDFIKATGAVRIHVSKLCSVVSNRFPQVANQHNVPRAAPAVAMPPQFITQLIGAPPSFDHCMVNTVNNFTLRAPGPMPQKVIPNAWPLDKIQKKKFYIEVRQKAPADLEIPEGCPLAKNHYLHKNFWDFQEVGGVPNYNNLMVIAGNGNDSRNLSRTSEEFEEYWLYKCAECEDASLQAVYIPKAETLLALKYELHRCAVSTDKKKSKKKKYASFSLVPDDRWILPCDYFNIPKKKMYIISPKDTGLGTVFEFQGKTKENELIFECTKCAEIGAEVLAVVSFIDGKISVDAHDRHFSTECFKVDLVATLEKETGVLVNF